MTRRGTPAPSALAAMGALATAAALAVAVGPGCSQGSGGGTACGTLDIAQCWTGPFNLQPDFFAAVTAQGSSSLQIRVQNGGDYETFSDGIAFLIDDIGTIVGANGQPSELGQTLSVSLPPGVTPPGVPLVANANPSQVHAVLYLQKTCRTQNVALYAMDAVTLSATGTCGAADIGEPPNSCPLLSMTPTNAIADASTLADGGTQGTVVGSSIVFDNLFDGNTNASNANERLINVPQFDLYFADPRDVMPGGLGPPPPCRAHLVGNFKFYFERGQPEQPFQ